MQDAINTLRTNEAKRAKKLGAYVAENHTWDEVEAWGIAITHVFGSCIALKAVYWLAVHLIIAQARASMA
jgi:hypothetical protein